MCTVTFVPKNDGFVLAMNRDDAYARAQTNPPAIHTAGNSCALFPSEMNGGTWIAANDSSLAFSLLNWSRPAPGRKTRSRAEVVPAVAHAATLSEVDLAFNTLKLDGLYPFRLIAFSLPDQGIREWRWHTHVETAYFPWEYRHWFSSGSGDEEAAAQRQKICSDALQQTDALSHDWLRRLHQSHGSGVGPFSICVHRETGGTLSYTEISLSRSRLVMKYRPASACSNEPLLTTNLPIGRNPAPLS